MINIIEIMADILHICAYIILIRTIKKTNHS